MCRCINVCRRNWLPLVGSQNPTPAILPKRHWLPSESTCDNVHGQYAVYCLLFELLVIKVPLSTSWSSFITNEAYINDDIELKHTQSEHVPSDMLCKLVPAPRHQYLRQFVDDQIPSISYSKISPQIEKANRGGHITFFRKYGDNIAVVYGLGSWFGVCR